MGCTGSPWWGEPVLGEVGHGEGLFWWDTIVGGGSGIVSWGWGCGSQDLGCSEVSIGLVVGLFFVMYCWVSCWVRGWRLGLWGEGVGAPGRCGVG